jgi:hypothetical protein
MAARLRGLSQRPASFAMMLPLKTVTVGANQFGGSPVTRTLALVLVLAVALPVLAFAAAVSAAGASDALISGGLSFFVVVGAVIAMLFEIKRLADQDVSA